MIRILAYLAGSIKAVVFIILVDGYLQVTIDVAWY